MQILTDKKQALILITSVIVLSLIFIDYSIVTVALINIQKGLHLSHQEATWVINSYILMLAIFTIPSGRLVDYLGSKWMIILGVSVFLLGSILCTIATSGTILILGRIIQGLGAVQITSPTIILLNDSIPMEKRGQTLGVVLALSSSFLVTAPIMGGFLTQYLNWHWIFAINIPICITALILLTTLEAPVRKHKRESSFDFMGLFFLAITLATFTLALLKVPTVFGIKINFVYLIITSMISLTLFLITEYRVKTPLINFNMFRDKAFALVSILAVLIQFFAMFVMYIIIYFRVIYEYTPVQTSFAILPIGIAMILASVVSGRFFDRYGKMKTALTGAILIFGGFICTLILFEFADNYFVLLPGLLGFAVGVFFTNNGFRFLMLDFAKPEHKGMAIGLFAGFRQIGGTIGIAILGYIFYFGQSIATVMDKSMLMKNFYHCWIFLLLLSTLILIASVYLYSQANSDVKA